MREVYLDTDPRPVRSVVTGQGGMEAGAGPKRTGLATVVITGNASTATAQMNAFAKSLEQLGRNVGMSMSDFAKLLTQAKAKAQRAFRLPRLVFPTIELPTTWRGRVRRWLFGTWRYPRPRFERRQDGELYYVDAKPETPSLFDRWLKGLA